MKYMKDQSTLVTPMDHPLHHDRQYKQLEIKQQIQQIKQPENLFEERHAISQIFVFQEG